MPFDERDLDRFGESIRSEANQHLGDLTELERREQSLRRRQLVGVGSLVVMLLAGAMFAVSRRPAADTDLALSGANNNDAASAAPTTAGGRSCIPPRAALPPSSVVTSVPNTRGGVSSTASVTQSTGPSTSGSPSTTPTSTPSSVTSSVPAGASSQGAAPAGARSVGISAPASGSQQLVSSPLPPGEDPTPGSQLPLAAGGGVRTSGPEGFHAGPGVGRQGTPTSPTSPPLVTAPSSMPASTTVVSVTRPTVSATGPQTAPPAGPTSSPSPSLTTTILPPSTAVPSSTTTAPPPSQPSGSDTSTTSTGPPICCVTTGLVGVHVGEPRTNGFYRLEFEPLPAPYKGKEGTRCHQLAAVFTDDDPPTAIGYVTVHHPDDDLPTSTRDWDAKLIGSSLVEKPAQTPTLDVNGTTATVAEYGPGPGSGGASPTTYVVTLTTPGGTVVVHGDRLDQIAAFLRHPNRAGLIGV